ncbi:MAG: hypothetical protein FWF82_03245 [Oscillospiraceae bacterium]|nr:hypothetical protein [Oscillospiraceae bacterium]
MKNINSVEDLEELTEKRIGKFHNRKKAFVILTVILLPIWILSGLFFYSYITGNTRVNVMFADNVTLEYAFYNEENRFVSEIVGEDKESLKKVFSGRFSKNESSRCSGQAGLCMTFSSEDETIKIFVAGDGCNQFTVIKNEKERYISVDDDDLINLQEIFGEYRI